MEAGALNLRYQNSAYVSTAAIFNFPAVPVCAKWAYHTPSRVAPQVIPVPAVDFYCQGGFFYYQPWTHEEGSASLRRCHLH